MSNCRQRAATPRAETAPSFQETPCAAGGSILRTAKQQQQTTNNEGGNNEGRKKQCTWENPRKKERMAQVSSTLCECKCGYVEAEQEILSLSLKNIRFVAVYLVCVSVYLSISCVSWLVLLLCVSVCWWFWLLLLLCFDCLQN